MYTEKQAGYIALLSKGNVVGLLRCN